MLRITPFIYSFRRKYLICEPHACLSGVRQSPEEFLLSLQICSQDGSLGSGVRRNDGCRKKGRAKHSTHLSFKRVVSGVPA